MNDMNAVWEKQEHGYFVLVFFASHYFQPISVMEMLDYLTEVVHIQPGLLEPAPGPVIILGIHLCGLLSIRAIETFNRGPKCVAFALKPCCLPSMHYVPWFDGQITPVTA